MIRKVDTFPQIMEGEALFSAIAQYHLWSGNSAQAHSHMDLFGNKCVRATFDIPSYTQALSDRLPEELELSARSLMLRHTHLRYYQAFLPVQYAEEIVDRAIGGDASLHFTLGLNSSIVCRPENLAFCEACLDEMRLIAGRLWWRLDHQLPGVFLCPDHGEVLKRSTVPFASKQFLFVAASKDSCPADAEDLLSPQSECAKEKLLDPS